MVWVVLLRRVEVKGLVFGSCGHGIHGGCEKWGVGALKIRPHIEVRGVGGGSSVLLFSDLEVVVFVMSFTFLRALVGIRALQAFWREMCQGRKLALQPR